MQLWCAKSDVQKMIDWFRIYIQGSVSTKLINCNETKFRFFRTRERNIRNISSFFEYSIFFEISNYRKISKISKFRIFEIFRKFSKFRILEIFRKFSKFRIFEIFRIFSKFRIFRNNVWHRRTQLCYFINKIGEKKKSRMIE